MNRYLEHCLVYSSGADFYIRIGQLETNQFPHGLALSTLFKERKDAEQFAQLVDDYLSQYSNSKIQEFLNNQIDTILEYSDYTLQDDLLPNGFWQHKKTGNFYKILFFTNMEVDVEKRCKFPPTVVYCNKYKKVFSRTIESFLESFQSVHIDEDADDGLDEFESKWMNKDDENQYRKCSN
ncbi:MAG: hypothetical protein WC679_01355 [Bacteroidales bacterium]|jgi:hypothetical protein